MLISTLRVARVESFILEGENLPPNSENRIRLLRPPLHILAKLDRTCTPALLELDQGLIPIAPASKKFYISHPSANAQRS
jgi:hypothetical protein